jgi:hypothetical protein
MDAGSPTHTVHTSMQITTSLHGFSPHKLSTHVLMVDNNSCTAGADDFGQSVFTFTFQLATPRLSSRLALHTPIKPVYSRVYWNTDVSGFANCPIPIITCLSICSATITKSLVVLIYVWINELKTAEFTASRVPLSLRRQSLRLSADPYRVGTFATHYAQSIISHPFVVQSQSVGDQASASMHLLIVHISRASRITTQR